VFTLDVRSNITDVIAKLKTNRTDQLPYATALALTRTAQLTQQYLVSLMPRVFDRPTPYTLNSLYIRSATKSNLVASVYIKDEALRGTPADRYLRPEIEGGQRNLKRSERALQASGLMPANSMAVPAIGAEIDQYGNMKAAQIIAILAAVKALAGQSYTSYAAAAARRKRGKYKNLKYFVAMPGSHLKPGVYERLSARHVVPVMLFVPRFVYRQRFDFYGEGQRFAQSAFNDQFAKAWLQALSTAR
jgi:hypothetical protein